MKIINQSVQQQILLVFTIAIAAFSPLYATEGTMEPINVAVLSEDDFLADIPVVLTATRLAQPITEAPAAITIIDREMIRASGAREITDLFRMVPGFVVSHDSGHQPIVSYHGLTDEYAVRMQVLIDGRSVYSPVFGGVDWANLPLAMDDIKRIEIIRGPNSASFGSNSFLSVINIITQHAAETTGTFVRGTRGSNGVKDVIVRIGESTENFDYRVTASIANDNGFEARADDRRMKTVRFRGDYQINAEDNLMFQTGITRGIREIDSKRLQAVTDRRVKLNFEHLRWQRQINNSEALSLQFFHTLENNDQIFDVILPSGVHIVVDSSTQSERFDFELQHTKQLQENTRMVWGLGLRQDSAKGPHIFGTDPATGYTGNKKYFYNRVARVFSNIEWRIKNNLTLNLGAMWEKSDLAKQEFSPRAGLNYSITPEQSIRIIASRATRTPSLNEARSNFRFPVENYPLSPFNFISTIWVGNKTLNRKRSAPMK
ncbi:TonB-dependent receptor [Beggiatoa alba]|nr:TonB-dependent receptor [Beggiatoa alba]